jgi:hypothetical protein
MDESLETPEAENPEMDNLDSIRLSFDDLNDPYILAQRVYYIWWHWADFHLYITSPHIDTLHPPILIEPETIPGTNEKEFVYPIYDAGDRLSTSKAQDMFYAGNSMCKLYYTIEKMIHILVERLKSGGIASDVEVQIAFGGHQLAQRKAFESVINLNYNVVVTNFDPGEWGEAYLQTVKRMSDKYGYPPESPRDTYRKAHGSSSVTARR